MPEYVMSHRRGSGQGLVEYGLILGLIAVLIVTIFVAFEGIVDIGADSSGTLSNEGIGRAAAALSAGVY
jgi:Flp pilus assembly pilin Flp